MKNIILIFVLLSVTISFGQQRAVFVDGKIKVFNQLPKKWVTPTGSHNGIRNADSTFIYSLGIRNVVQPTLTDNQSRDTIYFDVQNDVFKYAIKDFTQQEIDRYNESQLNSDVSAQKENKYENDGQQLYRKIKHRIRRKLDKGTITLNQFNAIRRTLRPALIPLMTGDWDIVKENLNAITPPANANLLTILNNIKGLIDDYMINNY